MSENEQVAPEKTSRWTDAEREAISEIETRVPLNPERPALPPWIGAFEPTSTFTANGWECAVRHVGYEGGHWMILVEPIEEAEPTRYRSEYRRLKVQVGKKKAREMIRQKIKDYDAGTRTP